MLHRLNVAVTGLTPSRAGSLPHLECVTPVGASLLAKLLAVDQGAGFG